MTDNHMVFFAEIAFIYGGNDSSEKDVFGSERSSEKIIKSSERSSETTAISSGTGSGIQPQNSWTIVIRNFVPPKFRKVKQPGNGKVKQPTKYTIT